MITKTTNQEHITSMHNKTPETNIGPYSLLLTNKYSFTSSIVSRCNPQLHITTELKNFHERNIILLVFVKTVKATKM